MAGAGFLFLQISGWVSAFPVPGTRFSPSRCLWMLIRMALGRRKEGGIPVGCLKECLEAVPAVKISWDASVPVPVVKLQEVAGGGRGRLPETFQRGPSTEGRLFAGSGCGEQREGQAAGMAAVLPLKGRRQPFAGRAGKEKGGKGRGSVQRPCGRIGSVSACAARPVFSPAAERIRRPDTGTSGRGIYAERWQIRSQRRG